MKLIYDYPPPVGYVGFWCNKHGSFKPHNHMFQFLSSLSVDKVMALPYGDGLVEEEGMNNANDYTKYGDDVLLGVHCYRHVKIVKNKLICLPLDDDIFQYGLKTVLMNEVPNLDLPWEEKKPIAYWRGNGNMRSTHNPRASLIKLLLNNKNANARFIRTPDTLPSDYQSPYFDQRFDGWYQPVPLTEFVEHKYIFIIDNFIITSGLQVVFGLGSVPLLVSHPDTQFWFKSLLIPYVNYVPVNVSLDNLTETIDWLVNHDDLAKSIAENARALADHIFSPEYQRQYLLKNII